MRHRSKVGALALLGVLGFWACHDSTSPPGPPVALSASSRGVSLREDSLRVVMDSAAVSLSGANAATTSWTATHGGGAWLTLTSASGTGNGMIRWRRDATVLMAGASYVDTISVTLQGTAGATASLVDSVTVRDAPAQYIAVRRAWQPGERVALAAYIVRTGAMDDFSEVAAQAIAQEDSAVDVILNPAWHRPAGAPPAGIQLAPQFQAGWGARGLDILLVFDSLPDNPSVPATLGIQRDSLEWIAIRWWNPADSTWKGWIIRGTTASTWSGYQSMNTVTFDASGAHSGQGGGEARRASGTYWEASGGGYRLTYNSGYGTFSRLTGGPYLGGDFAVGQMAGRLNNINMPRLLGTDTPTTSTFTFDFGTARITSWQIRCYFTPVPPVFPYNQCTGQAAARLVAAARAGRVTAAMLAGISDPILNAMTPRLRSRSRRWRRA